MDQSLSSAEKKSSIPELRLLDRRAFIGFPPLTLEPGLTITDFALQIPDVKFPFNVTTGALRYQRRRLDFGLLDLLVDEEWIGRRVSAVAGKLADLEDLRIRLSSGHLEARARMPLGEHAPLTFKVSLDADGEKVAVCLYDVRFYGFAATAAAQVPLLITHWVQELNLLPEVQRRGASGFVAHILPPLARFAAVSRGYRTPSLDHARLSSIEISPHGVRLRFSAGGFPPPAPADEGLLMALEGARAFSDAEELIAQGRLGAAREFYLMRGDADDAHPFAAERLLSLLVADPSAHEMALDLADSLRRRFEKSTTALWSEAVVRERRGERARAAERYLSLSNQARKDGDSLAALCAAEAAARVAREQAPQLAVTALHQILGLKPDHLPSLQELARSSDFAGDRAGAIRAYRRIAALSRDPSESAQAHLQLARLCAQSEDDEAAARLHCEAALRLSPDYPEALQQLAELCFKAGEHLRAIKAADRLHQVAMARHQLERVAEATLLAGRIWEVGLKQDENALLRYREAVSLRPAHAVSACCRGRVAEKVGRLQEALASYQQAIELAGPAPSNEEIRQAAHESHHAVARLARTRLGDPARAWQHLRAALALEPRDQAALDELLPYLRVSGHADELADACEKAAAVAGDSQLRAALLAESGELHRARLGNIERARRILASALEADPLNRSALESMLALAESRRDGRELCRCLRSLAELTTDPASRLRYYRRLAVAARDLAGDGDLAALALAEVLKLEPEDLHALAELCTLQRQRGDLDGLASSLEKRARAAERQGDEKLASTMLRELAQVLDVKLGRSAEAFFALEKAARLSTEPEVLLDFADLALRCERFEQGRWALETLIALDAKAAEHYLVRYASNHPGDVGVQRELASAYRQLGSKRELFEVLGKLWPRLEGEEGKETCREYVRLALDLKDSLPLEGAERCDVFSQIAELSLDIGELPTALAALQEASREGAAARRSEALVRRAVLLEQQGDWQSAGQSYEAALSLAPRHPVATEGLKRALRETEDWAGLAEVLAAEAAQASKDRAAPLYQELGLLYLHRLNQKRPAEAALRRTARLDKSNLLVRRELLTLLAERGELAAAAEFVEEAAESASPEAGAALLREGVRAAEAAGDLHLALRLARRAHQLSPAGGQFLLQLAHLLYVQGGWREALPLYRALADQIDPGDLPDVAREVLLRLADLAEQSGSLDLAEQTLTRLLRQEPLCAPAAERLSSLLWAKRPRDAIEVLWSFARQLGPSQQRVDRLVSLASRVRAELADVDLASQLLREAAEKAPDPISAHRCLAELYRAAGRIPELLDELAAIRTLSRQRGDVAGALDSADEEVQLLVQSGRVDDALSSLQRMSELAAEASSVERAASYQLRRAELWRDLKCDLEAAQQCLQASYQLSKQLFTAEAGIALAQRRHDPAAEAEWLQLSVELHSQAGQRAQLLRKAADVYRHRLDRPDAAAAALLALSTFEAQDLALMAEVAEQLQQAGKNSEVAQLDSALLASDPLRSPNFERHLAFLKDCADHRALAALLLRRGRALTGPEAARSYLDAALSYRVMNQEELARECEREAFGQAPEDDQAFAAAKSQAESDPRQLADVLFHRAQSKPEEATALLRERAQLLAREEDLLAAQALDDLLQVAPEDAEALRERGDLAARAGGPSAAQPFDRRLLAVARDALSPDALSKLYLRLGGASFASRAFRDAADSLEEVVRLNINGDQSREALSLLSESYSQLADMPGMFRVTLQLAERASAEEAEALYRRAADVVGQPAQAINALLPLARLHPSDADLVERAARGLRDLERYGELAELYERSAEASGGLLAAERLLAAAEIASQRLQNPPRAAADLERAAHLFLQLSQPAKALNCWLEAGAGEPKRQASDLSKLLLEKSRELGGEVHAQVLEQLVQVEDDPAAQAKLYAELGEACAQVADVPKARDAFQRALAADPQSLPAAKRLFELAPTFHQASLFVDLAEQLLHRFGAEALEAHREALSDAYNQLGRKGDAYLCLSRLPETAPRLRKRVGLARELGLYGEALQLQERLSDDPAELEKVLLGYLQAHLLPFAVRLGERLLQSHPLSAQTRRWMAQRFAPSSEGASLAGRLWPDLLKANVLDADGWTLFAEALHHVGRSADAQIADGFGAALSGDGAPTSLVPIRPVARSATAEWSAERPQELMPITSDSMPRLYSAIAPQLHALGAGEVRLYLSMHGGVEAFLLEYDELVIGAGALARFGAPELTYLIALALALGDRSRQLQHPGPVEGLEAAAQAAFDAVPGSLAACRVVAQLDERIRGSNPGSSEGNELLKTGPLFASLASHALERL